MQSPFFRHFQCALSPTKNPVTRCNYMSVKTFTLHSSTFKLLTFRTCKHKFKNIYTLCFLSHTDTKLEHIQVQCLFALWTSIGKAAWVPLTEYQKQFISSHCWKRQDFPGARQYVPAWSGYMCYSCFIRMLVWIRLQLQL